MAAINCKTKDCKLLAMPLSMFDKPRTMEVETGITDYDRTTKWKCLNGHISITTSIIKVGDLFPPKERDEDESVKRFHRKGFAGHVVKPLNYEVPPKPWPNEMTNHERMVIRKEHRQRLQGQP